MSFAIVILPKAHRQILEAGEWWAQHRPLAPSLFEDELERALRRLSDSPHLGTRALWSTGRLGEVRRVLLRRVEYVLFYRPRPAAQRIEVLALWQARRQSAPTR